LLDKETGVLEIVLFVCCDSTTLLRLNVIFRNFDFCRIPVICFEWENDGL